MGYDMYIEEQPKELNQKITALQDERKTQAAMFELSSPISQLVKQQESIVKAKEKDLARQTDAAKKPTQIAIDKTQAMRDELMEAKRAYWQAESAALKEIDDELKAIEDKLHFHLNIWGMGTYLTTMERLGMLAVTDEKGKPITGYPPTWPAYQDFDISDDEYGALDEEYYGDITNCSDQRYCDYINAIDKTKSQTYSTSGLNAHKFSSNDGWHVTPKEIKSALKTYNKAVAKNPAKVKKIIAKSQNEPSTTKEVAANTLLYWDKWITFLEIASDSEGIRVF